jgi:CBS domain containing-hemolysin-like protein
LGPLTLNDLHKTGHSRLPVINGDIDHVVGILNLKGLLALDIKRSTTAEKAMDPKVYYIRADQVLQHALAAFLRTKHQLFIVVNEYRETVGLLTLEDAIEALIGRKIVDEFDAHDDLRAVALRNPRDNNRPNISENV